MFKNIITILHGFIMGVAEIIPGVSGSTIALMFGIYEKFVDLLHSASELAKAVILVIIKREDIDYLKDTITNVNWSFGIRLAIGMALAVSLLPGVIVYLLENIPHYLFAVLLGLMISAIIIPIRQVKNFNITNTAIALITFLVMIYLLGQEGSSNIAEPSALRLFLVGTLAISGMILPGVSGSFIMLLLGVYYYVIGGIHDVISMSASSDQIINLAVFGVGVIVGFMVIVRILKLALNNYKDQLMHFIIGLLLASTTVLWPFVHSETVGDETEIINTGIDGFSKSEVTIILSLVLVVSVLFGVINWRSNKAK